MTNEIYTDEGWLTPYALSQGLAHTQHSGRVQLRARPYHAGKYEICAHESFTNKSGLCVHKSECNEVYANEFFHTLVYYDINLARKYFAELCKPLKHKLNEKLNRVVIL